MAKDRNMREFPDEDDAQPDLQERLTKAIELLSARPADSSSDLMLAMMSRLTDALEMVSKAQADGSKLIASETRRAHRPSNEIVPMRSVFNRRGETLADYKKPALKCAMFIPWIVEWESCSREEVELLNLLEPGEYIMTRNDRSKVRVGVKAEYALDEVTMTRLLMRHDTTFNNDNQRLSAPLVDILRGMLKQHAPAVAAQAALVMSDEEEEALIAAGELSVSL